MIEIKLPRDREPKNHEEGSAYVNEDGSMIALIVDIDRRDDTLSAIWFHHKVIAGVFTKRSFKDFRDMYPYYVGKLDNKQPHVLSIV